MYLSNSSATVFNIRIHDSWEELTSNVKGVKSEETGVGTSITKTALVTTKANSKKTESARSLQVLNWWHVTNLLNEFGGDVGAGIGRHVLHHGGLCLGPRHRADYCHGREFQMFSPQVMCPRPIKPWSHTLNLYLKQKKVGNYDDKGYPRIKELHQIRKKLENGTSLYK